MKNEDPDNPPPNPQVQKLSPEVFASCSRDDQTALIVPSVAVTEIELFRTLDKDRVVIGVPLRMVRRRMSFEQIEQVLAECEDLASEHFRWEV